MDVQMGSDQTIRQNELESRRLLFYRQARVGIGQ